MKTPKLKKKPTTRERLYDSLRKEGMGMRAKPDEKDMVRGKDMRPEESASPKDYERKPVKLAKGGMAKK